MCNRVANGSFRNLDISRLTLFLLLEIFEILDVARETFFWPASCRVVIELITLKPLIAIGPRIRKTQTQV